MQTGRRRRTQEQTDRHAVRRVDRHERQAGSQAVTGRLRQRQTGRYYQRQITTDRQKVRQPYIQATTESLGRNVWHASPGHDAAGPPGTGTIVREHYG